MIEKFEIIEDTRHQSYVKHKLSHILMIVMCAVLCGLDELGDIVTFAENKAKFFKDNFGIEKIPSKPTISRVLSIIDGQKAAKVIIDIMKTEINESEKVIAVDGKAIRSTYKTDKPHSALQIITAYLTDSGVVLGQEKINEKTNEIPVLRQMLEYMNIKGKTITADALHCQKETCAKIIEKQGNYVLGLKENQKTLHDNIELYFKNEITNKYLETFTTTEKNGGRIEKRICYKISDLSWLEERSSWAGLKTVFSVKRIVSTANKTTEEISYYISSQDVSAKELLFLSREHWKIESMHWMLDVVLSEDKCLFWNENAHITLNILRKYALLLHKQYISNLSKNVSVKKNMLNCLINDTFILKVISQ
ncbi:MAG: ISAs1 family transposase [Clostridiales bacterium]|nr:ISAs1 family transposase [Clostridiales bacterium]